MDPVRLLNSRSTPAGEAITILMASSPVSAPFYIRSGLRCTSLLIHECDAQRIHEKSAVGEHVMQRLVVGGIVLLITILSGCVSHPPNYEHRAKVAERLLRLTLDALPESRSTAKEVALERLADINTRLAATRMAIAMEEAVPGTDDKDLLQESLMSIEKDLLEVSSSMNGGAGSLDAQTKVPSRARR